MEMRTGYKQTEVGVIPDDWLLHPIGSICTIFGRIGFRGYTKKDIVKEGQGAIALNPSNIQAGRLVLDTCTYVTWEKYHESPEIKIQEGDVILVKTGSTTGKTCYVDQLPTEATLNPQMVVFKRVTANSRLLTYIFSTPVFLRQLAATIVGGALPTLSQKQVANYKIPLPADGKEQSAIAAALSDVDALLKGLERIIAKKRDLKQAAMQQLLTGQTRLPGFYGEWEVNSLALIAPLQRGFDLPTREVTPGPYPVVYSNGVEAFHDKFLVKGPGVVTGRSGTLGRVHYVEADFWPHNTSLWVTWFGDNVPKFIYYLYCFLHFERFSSGSGVPTLNRNDAHTYETAIPSDPEEQRAIADVVSDMDAELAALEARRDKTRDLKQAMMQELLTGKIRLVPSGGAHA
jgi:type I restriction enzyme, S subunit